MKPVFQGRTLIPWLIRHRLWVHAFTILSGLVSALLASRLELRTDFAELLPDSLRSVKALKIASQRIGGTGLLIVGVESPSFSANRRFMDDLVKGVSPWVGHRLRFVEYNFKESIQFTQKYGLHYLSNDNLANLRDYLRDQQTRKWDSAVGSLLGLDDDDADSAQAAPADKKSLEDLLKEHPAGPAIGAVLNYPDGYLSAHDGHVLALAMRPFSSGLSVGESRQLLADTEAIIKKLDPQKYHAQLKTVMAGSVPQAVEEFDTISKDIFGTALELVALIAVALFLFLWSVRIILLLCLNLGVAVLWTFALTQLHIGYLNAQTAFLGSLVVGTGINYSVIYVCRFIEARRRNVPLEEALIEALDGTLLPTLIASLTTGAGFLVLLLASNRGLSQFGFIGSIGVFFCWICSFFIFPLWMYETEKGARAIRHYANPLARRLSPWGIAIGDFVVAHPRSFAAAWALLAFGAVSRLGPLYREPLEYNFDNLRNKTSTSVEVEAFRDRVYDAFPTSLTPSLAFTDNEADARGLCPAVRALKASLPPAQNVISSCSSLYDLLPAPHVPPDRARLMAEVKRLLANPRMRFADQADLLRGLGERASPMPPTREDLPEQILRTYREQDGRVGLFATINPDGAKPLNDARNLLNFTNSLNTLKAGPGQAPVLVAGDSFVLADILRTIKAEGPLLTTLAFVTVVVITFFLAGGLTSGVLIAFCLTVGTALMLGIQSMLGLKYNFFNFIALPLTFGIGIDYPINVFIRYRQEGFRAFGKVFAGSGMAVLLCSTTTTIGYYTLIGAASQALAGFGKLAILGEICCLLTALFLLPALIALPPLRDRLRPRP